MVAGFAQSPPNETLIRFAVDELSRPHSSHAVDIGCGAARNAVPLARLGWHVTGLDSSRPMLDAAVGRARVEAPAARLRFAQSAMDALPIRDASADLIVAHGVWNLARSDGEFRAAIREAARIARPGAALFVFTFSRHTVPEAARPVAGETLIYTEFSGEPQCFVTEAQLVDELAAAGFSLDPAVPLTEHNLPRAGAFRTAGPPAIYEAAFRFR